MKPLRQFDLNLLVIFEALVTEAHVSRAAKKVFLSQSATSHALNRLRQQINDPILVRTEKGLQPTPRALAMLPEVQSALQIIEHSLTPPNAFTPSESTRTFRIACTDFFETVVFPDWFSHLQHHAPHINVEIDLIAENTATQRIENGDIDLIVGLDMQQALPSHLIVEPWQTEKLVCLASTDSTISTQLDLDTYLVQKHIVFFDLDGETNSNIDRWLQAQGLTRQHISRTTNYMAAARVVAKTCVIMTLPYHMAQLFSRLLPLKMLEPPAGMPDIEMAIISHPLYKDDPAIQWLKQEIMSYKINSYD